MERINMNNMWQDTLINNPDFLRQSMQTILQKMLQEQFDRHIGASPYERTDERVSYRNGTYERTIKTRIGTITLHVCRDRDGKFRTDLFDRYQRVEKALVIGIVEMYLHGASTRDVGPIVEELCGFEVSKSLVSEVSTKIDADIQVWRSRSLDVVYIYLIIDARYEKVRENGRVISKAFVTIIGITMHGMREIIGTYIINSESFDEWNNCFIDLKNRGLQGVVYAVSDENFGLVAALKKNFQGILIQRCQVHFMRNLLSKVAKADQGMITNLLRDIFAAPSKEAAIQRLSPLVEFLKKQKKEKVAQWLMDNIEDTFAVYHLSEQHRKKMRSTNMVERLNEELKRRSKVIRIFPTEQSCLRLLSAVCEKISDAWADRRYFEM